MDDLFETNNTTMTDKKVDKIHLRIQQNGKRYITTIEGLDADLDQKRIMKAMKKQFNCNGNISANADRGDIIQLQGDHRSVVIEWLIAQEILTKQDAAERIVVHGA
jgi:translation initiation factor 1